MEKGLKARFNIEAGFQPLIRFGHYPGALPQAEMTPRRWR